MSLSRLSTAASSPDAPVAAEEVTQVKETPFVLKGELTNEDAAGMVASNGFPIAPDMLILQAKKVLAANNGCDDPDLLADDFKFVAPVVGPLSKKEFTNAFASFKIDDAFPDINANFHNFWVDPFEPGRVWYVTRATATHTGTLAGAIPPTGIRVDSPPQANSMTFNVDGQCTQLTVGYVLDKQLGNTGGLGGVFGILYAIGYGLPFPEAQPWEKSWQYALFQQTSGFATAVRKTLGL
ncbi:GONST5 protein [Pycnococcus provasolii]